ncbi:MSMEG_0569 family flavin-dependent oxidoreductase [Streptomyces sp. 8L]|uniref:MSMEG_0569 family flavin-dependent oxidoreductase n=1 Tax=Streptomyces sp. 8L TaxID=2877242 RepID=UPI001CD4CF63|nr:MSMEG_0569 family flavin-dependent oxidoreductase [Streptomyces sp. 8L]MCA1217760.1 MSMEG_0569 family flavin-dependent oxidoreductase [Streptomyces sp. 8L]
MPDSPTTGTPAAGLLPERTPSAPAAPLAPAPGSHHPVAVVGGGQAGLSVSYCLRERGIGHVVLESHRVGHEWRARRWDTFCLVTPNWQCRLPGHPYRGDDPDGFMVREEIVRYLEDYAARFQPPVAEGVRVTRLRRGDRGVFELRTTAGDFTADQVVVATGPYHRPAVPRLAERFPAAVHQLHSSGYRNPRDLPGGAVLVVGTGQSGCQIAEDLHLAGREVHLAVGSAPRVARTYRGRDCVAWLDAMGHYDKTVDSFPDSDAVRMRANHYVTGRDGGRDIDLRAFARDGMRLYGRLTGADGPALTFADDLAARLDHADAVAESIKDSIDAHIGRYGIDAPAEPRYQPVWRPAPPGDPSCPHTALDLERAGIGTVVWATGFTRDHRWVEAPVFDGRGYPMHRRGITSLPGLYFIGLPWQHTWGSGRFEAVGRDAAFLADHIDATRRVADVCGALTGAPTALSAALPVG